MGKKIMNNGVTKAFTHCLPQFLLHEIVILPAKPSKDLIWQGLYTTILNCGINPAKTNQRGQLIGTTFAALMCVIL